MRRERVDQCRRESSRMKGKRGAPGGIRTPNLLIRSQMLYPLSYGRTALEGQRLSYAASGPSRNWAWLAAALPEGAVGNVLDHAIKPLEHRVAAAFQFSGAREVRGPGANHVRALEGFAQVRAHG